MGIILSRFRKKVSTKEKLENIQKEIDALEDYRTSTEKRGKKFVGYFVGASLLLVVLFSLLFYYYLPPTLDQRLILTFSLVGFIILVYLLKKILTWYFRRKLVNNEKKLSNLNKEKEKILDQVMETETYKVAKEILEIHAPEILRNTMTFKGPVPPTPISTKKPPQQTPAGEVRHRIVASTPYARPNIKPPFPSTPAATGTRSIPGTLPPLGLSGNVSPLSRPVGSVTPFNRVPLGNQSLHPTKSPVAASPMHFNRGNYGNNVPPGPPLPRPIPPRERSYFDRFVEYLIGDGPSNRYALICRNCQSNNGMAAKDEFEYVAFRCAYCFHYNPARKQRPTAPKIEPLATRRFLQLAQEDQQEISKNDESIGVSLLESTRAKPSDDAMGIDDIHSYQVDSHKNTDNDSDDIDDYFGNSENRRSSGSDISSSASPAKVEEELLVPDNGSASAGEDSCDNDAQLPPAIRGTLILGKFDPVSSFSGTVEHSTVELPPREGSPCSPTSASTSIENATSSTSSSVPPASSLSSSDAIFPSSSEHDKEEFISHS